MSPLRRELAPTGCFQLCDAAELCAMLGVLSLQMESRLVLARLVQRFSLTHDGQPVKTSKLVIPVATEGGMNFTVRMRDVEDGAVDGQK